MGTERRWLDRDDVREHAACPKCGAAMGFNCVGVRGRPRTSNHEQRVRLAERRLGFERVREW
jgi:hypothetical protein